MKKRILEKLVKESYNYTQVCEKIYGNRYCGNRNTIKKYIKDWNIDISHFTYRSSKNPSKTHYNRIPNSNLFIMNSTADRSTVKKRLYSEGLKMKKCEMCGQGEEWYDKKIVHILDHINGIRTDNRIENLRIVCPNCNSTLPTQGGKNVKNYPIIGSKFNKKILTEVEKTHIRKEAAIKQQRVERPPYEKLKQEVKEMGYSATGRKYNVSDNAIRKWVKFYEKY